MGLSLQEYWSGLTFPPPEDLPDPGIKPTAPVAPTLTYGFFTTEPPGKSLQCVLYCKGKVNITCQVTDILVIHEKKNKESILQFVTLPVCYRNHLQMPVGVQTALWEGR